MSATPKEMTAVKLSQASIKALIRERDLLDDNIYRYTNLGGVPEDNPTVATMRRQRNLIQRDIEDADPTNSVKWR